MAPDFINLSEISDDEEIFPGTIFRLYNVQRPDVIKKLQDLQNDDKRLLDFYDYLLVNTNLLSERTHLLLNVSLNCNKRGEILSVFKVSKSMSNLNAKQFKDYFSGNENIYISA